VSPSPSTSQILVCVELPVQVGAVKHEVRLALGFEIEKLCAALGLPGAIETDVSVSPTVSAPIFRLWVNERRVRYPRTLAAWIYGYITGELPPASATPEPDLAWLAQRVAQDAEIAVQLISLTCVEALKQRPSVLLSESSAPAYLQSIEQIEPELVGLQPTFLFRILHCVLDAWISIANLRAIADLIKLHKEKTAEELIQEIIAARSADSVEIRMPADYIREIASQATEADRGALPWLRDGLFEELGLTFPNFHFVADDTLRPRSFAFQINDLLTVPRAALPPGTLLVNDTPQRLGLSTDSVSNPATEQPATLAPLNFVPSPELEGVTTWTPIGYLTLCMADAIRAHAACFVTLRTVRDSLRLLKGTWSATIQTLRTEVTDQQLTSILQQLVAEGVSLRDLLSIFERIIDREYLSTESSALAALDDYPSEVPWSGETTHDGAFTSFIRAGLRRGISAKLARGTTTLVTYLLDSAIENTFLAAGGVDGLNENETDRILEAFGAELGHLPSTAQVPSVLTTADIRPIVRAVIAQEYPKVAVVAHEEISPDINVMPVARISLTVES
jgi:type III secretory pathway component EscV